jgi:hypothetical protein
VRFCWAQTLALAETHGRDARATTLGVTAAQGSDIKFSLDENSQTANEAFIVIGKTAARGF